MSSSQLILDTDILSLLMRKNSSVLAKAADYLAQHGNFTISIITRYEILRGLKEKEPRNRRHYSKTSVPKTESSQSLTLSCCERQTSMRNSTSEAN